MYKVGIIGAGKVGTSLGLYLFNKGDLSLEGFYSKSSKSAQLAADLTRSKVFESLEELVKVCYILIITTPDDEIKKVWSEIKKLNIENKIVCHCSGSLSSSVFFDRTTKGIYSCSMHPMLAISSRENSYKDLGGAFFTLEGDQEAVEILYRQLKLMGNPYKVLSSSDKRRYHLATVCISNLVIGLGKMATNLLEEYGFREEEALQALSVLGKKNVEALFEKGPIQALTGPVERADIGTIQGHIDSISDPEWQVEREIYIKLSQYLVEIAKEKNPDRNYKEIEKECKKGDTGFNQ